MKQFSKQLAIVAVLAVSLGACQEKQAEKTADAKVAVKVNGAPISVAELENKVGGHGDMKQPISGSLMKMTVETELLRQAAVQAKLDADEDIRASIANSTRMILATAYLQKQLAAVAKPTDADISEFYKQNPARFAERKQFDVQEFNIQPPPGKAAEIQAQLAKSKKPDDFDQWLSTNKIPHTRSPATVTGDQLPDEFLQKVKNVAVGGSVVMGGDNQMNVIFVLAEQPQPIALEEANRMIKNMLMDKRKREALDSTMKQLHDKAKVEYVAPYSEKGLAPPGKEQ